MFPGWSRMKCNTCSVSLNFERIMRKTGPEWVACAGALSTLLRIVSEFANRARLRMDFSVAVAPKGSVRRGSQFVFAFGNNFLISTAILLFCSHVAAEVLTLAQFPAQGCRYSSLFAFPAFSFPPFSFPLLFLSLLFFPLFLFPLFLFPLLLFPLLLFPLLLFPLLLFPLLFLPLLLFPLLFLPLFLFPQLFLPLFLFLLLFFSQFSFIIFLIYKRVFRSQCPPCRSRYHRENAQADQPEDSGALPGSHRLGRGCGVGRAWLRWLGVLRNGFRLAQRRAATRAGSVGPCSQVGAA